MRHQRRNLTDKFIRSCKAAAADDRNEYPDGIVPGLELRVTDRGHRSFILLARYPLNPKNPARRALGNYGAVTLQKAREKARQWLELIGKGIDPRIEEERQRAAHQRRQANTWEAVVADYLTQRAAGLAKGKEARAVLERELGQRWKGRPITEITPLDVAAAIKSILSRSGVYQAHNSFGWVRSLYNWAIGTGIYGVEASPTERLKPSELIGKREARDRILDDDELRIVWEAAGTLGYPYGPLFLLLILTGQREREVSEMRWPVRISNKKSGP
jgi:hypothetical protein